MNNPLITVAICTFNRSCYLKETLRSVINQTYSNLLIKVYDNNSSDDTASVVASFQDRRIVYIHNSTNIGGVANLNKALREARTKYIIVFHDDDIMLPEMVETEYKTMNNYPNASIIGQIFCNNFINEKSKSMPRIPHIYGHSLKIFNKNEYILHSMKTGTNIMMCPSVMFNTKIMQKSNLYFDEQSGPACDWLLWMQMNTLSNPIIGITTPIMRYRIHSDSDSQSVTRENKWMSSYHYLISWLEAQGFMDTQNLKDNFIGTSLASITLIEKDGILSGNIVQNIYKRLEDIKCKYAWTLTDSNVIANVILYHIVNYIGKGYLSLRDYFALKQCIARTYNSKVSRIKQLKWIVKIFYLKLRLILSTIIYTI